MQNTNKQLEVGFLSTTITRFEQPMAARDLFSKSNWFRKALSYSEQHHDKTYIISVPNGLVALEQMISPEEGDGFGSTQGKEFKIFTNNLAEQIRQAIPPGSKLYFYVCNKLRRVIQTLKSDYDCYEPTKGTKGIGEQLKNFGTGKEVNQND